MDRSLQIIEIAGLIFDAAVDPAVWPTAINKLADATGGTYGSIGTSNFATQEFAIVAPRHDPDYLRRYVEENWASHNLHWQRSGSVPIGQVFAAETFVPREEFVRSAFYHEWAAPQGHENALGVNVLVEGGSSTVASTMRPFSSGPFSAEEQRIFATLVPHIQRAVQLRHRLAALEMHRASSVAAFDHLRDGVVIVDDISLATARTHLRHVFDKTGVRRQAELVVLTTAGLATMRAGL